MTSRSPGMESLAVAERRSGADRRARALWALLSGGRLARRRQPRRRDERHLAAFDWYHSRWLAVAMLIVLLSAADAFLTLTLIGLGAIEVNPVMAPLVLGSGRGFAISKMLLTSGGVILLTLLSRHRAFGRLPVSAILYTVLAGYVVLIGYELWLLEQLSFGGLGEH